jgi:C4-dicarboxylate-specific signal transduction histidine kinase
VPPEKLAESLEKVANAATHAASTVRGLRGFLRKSGSGVEVLLLNDVIRSGAQLAAPYAREHGVKIVLRLADGLPSVSVNRTHLQQVLLNLLQNGIDALHESNCDDHRQIVVTTDREDFCSVRVAVADTGPGMTEQQRRRAFEPFYPPKSNGMGMGLPISRMIIESYGGRLYAPPSPRRGATLEFTLPGLSA